MYYQRRNDNKTADENDDYWIPVNAIPKQKSGPYDSYEEAKGKINEDINKLRKQNVSAPEYIEGDVYRIDQPTSTLLPVNSDGSNDILYQRYSWEIVEE